MSSLNSTTMHKMTQWFFRYGLFWRRKEKIEITVETKESWEVYWFRQSKTETCPVCQAETIFIPPDLGAQIVQADESVIAGLIANGNIHFNETSDAKRLICLSSLKRSMEKEERKVIES